MKCHCGCGKDCGNNWFLEGHTTFTKEAIKKGIETCRAWVSKGGKSTQKKYPELAKRKGKVLGKVLQDNPRIASQRGKIGGKASIKKQRKNRPYYYNNVPHDSKQERDISEIFYIKGMALIRGITVHVEIGNREFDWRTKGLEKFGINDGTFIEYHPWDMKGRSEEEYYQDRRKILDDNGYKDKLIVITSLKELGGMLFEEN